MKWVRALARTALLSLAAAAFAWLTAIYGAVALPPSPSPAWQAFRRHRAAAPHVDAFPEFVAEGMVVAIYAVAGRLLLRLRLSRVPRTQGDPIGLKSRHTLRGAQLILICKPVGALGGVSAPSP